MGIIDHEYRHGLHLYLGDKVVEVIEILNVTQEMHDRLSIELLTVTTDKHQAERVFKGSSKRFNDIIARADMVLVILILTFISSSIVIFVIIGYCCCRRKGNKIPLRKIFFDRHNNSSSSVQVC